MRFRSTVFCLAVILSCVTHGSDMVHAQSPALLEAFNPSNAYYQQGQYSEAMKYGTEALPNSVFVKLIIHNISM